MKEFAQHTAKEQMKDAAKTAGKGLAAGAFGKAISKTPKPGKNCD